MIQLPFRIRLITAPLGQTLDQDHQHLLKNLELTTAAPPRFLPFFTRRVVWVTMGWCSLRTILSIKGHSSQKSRLASSLLIPIFPDSNSREESNENTARCRMAWWALRCLVNTLRVRLTHNFSSAQLWCAIRHGEDVGGDFGGIQRL